MAGRTVSACVLLVDPAAVSHIRRRDATQAKVFVFSVILNISLHGLRGCKKQALEPGKVCRQKQATHGRHKSQRLVLEPFS